LGRLLGEEGLPAEVNVQHTSAQWRRMGPVVAGLPLGSECGGLALGSGDRRIAGFALADLEDRP
jgi:hypothetical protein